jgi:murein DD-endopeptidase MepM/ murein hydrolase activator NlpD
MLTAVTPKRNDKVGSGEFGAPRGSRRHNGIDYAVQPGSVLLSPIKGRVTKFGYCYSSDLSYRYIQVTDANRRNHRFFYVEPLEEHAINQEVGEGEAIGIVQDISAKYSSEMINHVHYEIKDASGAYVNPEEYWESHGGEE